MIKGRIIFAVSLVLFFTPILVGCDNDNESSEVSDDSTTLHDAIYEEEFTTAQQLIVDGADVNAQDDDELTRGTIKPKQLYQAIHDDDIERLKMLLSLGAYANVEIALPYQNGDDIGGKYPLFHAMILRKKHTAEKMKILLDAGADFSNDIDTESASGDFSTHAPPLIWLFLDCDYKGYDEIPPDLSQMVTLLLEAGADINAEIIFGSYHSDGSSANIGYLLQKDFEHPECTKSQAIIIEYIQKKPVTEIIHFLPALGDVEGIKQYLAQNADPNLIVYHNGEKTSLLYIIASEGTAEMLELLLKAGADAKNSYGGEALQFASERGNMAMVEMLIAAEANLTDKALHFAARNGNLDITKTLLTAGADINAIDADGNTLLHSASLSGEIEIVKIFLDKGLDIHARNKDEDTLLHLATDSGNAETVQFLLDMGLDINAKNSRGGMPLDVAFYDGHQAIFMILMEAGASPSSDINKLLYPASRNGYIEIVKYLIKKGADVNARDNDERTALHEASQNGQVAEIVAILIEAGSDVNATDNERHTALHLASINGRTETVKILLDAGADINITNNRKQTVLHYAARSGHAESIKLLLDAGADINAKDSENKTPLDLAKYRGIEEAINVLIEAGAE